MIVCSCNADLRTIRSEPLQSEHCSAWHQARSIVALGCCAECGRCARTIRRILDGACRCSLPKRSSPASATSPKRTPSVDRSGRSSKFKQHCSGAGGRGRSFPELEDGRLPVAAVGFGDEGRFGADAGLAGASPSGRGRSDDGRRGRTH